jgi:GLPGLI family protein
LEITKEQKEILGYIAKKATTEFAGRTCSTTEISIADGPYKFHGLRVYQFMIQ